MVFTRRNNRADRLFLRVKKTPAGHLPPSPPGLNLGGGLQRNVRTGSIQRLKCSYGVLPAGMFVRGPSAARCSYGVYPNLRKNKCSYVAHLHPVRTFSAKSGNVRTSAALSTDSRKFGALRAPNFRSCLDQRTNIPSTWVNVRTGSPMNMPSAPRNVRTGSPQVRNVRTGQGMFVRCACDAGCAPRSYGSPPYEHFTSGTIMPRHLRAGCTGK